MAISAIEQIRALEHEKSQLLEAAKIEVLERLQSDLKLLEELGLKYRLVQTPKRNPASDLAPSRTMRDAPCRICGFKTVRPHDARAHRWQETKAPFSNAEMKKRGMHRV